MISYKSKVSIDRGPTTTTLACASFLVIGSSSSSTWYPSSSAVAFPPSSPSPSPHPPTLPLAPTPLAAIDLYGGGTALNIDFSLYVPTEAEIKDRGKSNWLTKSLVLVQTSWFVLQCIARAIKHLPVTRLEIVTLAYAVMDFVIYIFWWNKPLNVNDSACSSVPKIGPESDGYCY